MKKFTSPISRVLALIVFAIALFLLSATAQAQTDRKAPFYSFSNVSLAGIGTTAGGATTTVTGGYIDCRQAQNVTLQTVFTFTSATTSNVVYTVDKSLDKVNWETVAPFVWTVAGNGTTTQASTTNLNVGGLGWLRLRSIQNTHASIVLTNTQFSASRKLNSP